MTEGPGAGVPSSPAPELPEALDLVRVRVPLRRPHRSAVTSEADRVSVIVGWHLARPGPKGSAVVGWAECPTLATPGYVTETTDEAWDALTGELGRAVLDSGTVPEGPWRTPAAAATLRDAALDARLRRDGRPLASFLAERTGLGRRSAVGWCAVVSGVDRDPSDVVAEATAAVGQGASMVKVKVSGAGDPLRPVEGLADRLGVPVAADANGTLVPDALRRLDGAGLAYVEQPLPADASFEELRSLRSGLDTPLALDESLCSVRDVRTALAAGALDAVSVKPARVGGVLAAAEIVALCASHDVDCFVGGMFELGVGRASAVAVAALTGCTLPTDLGPSVRYVERDIAEPLVTSSDGRLVVPVGEGFGPPPYAGVLDDVAIDRVQLRRGGQ